jgi:putative ABC transport system permease protein
MTDKYFYSLLVHYRSEKLEDLIPKLKSEWEKVEPDRPMAYSTIEEIFERTYTAERNLSTILSVAALFALLIAAFGLFGLTLFVARSRTREIGIRKVFGSSEEAIVSSFLRSNFIIVVVAELLSVPLTIYFLQKWLNNFPYRTGIAWWVFVIAFLIATVVVLATVYIHSRRLSRVNPVESLRYE